MLFEPNGPYTFDAVTKDAVAAVVAAGAHDALTAHEEVPNKEPVIPPFTSNEPVICNEPDRVWSPKSDVLYIFIFYILKISL